jgi:carboxymethylenebutenolidase
VPHRALVLPDAPHGYTMEDTSSYQAEGAERRYAELRTALEATLG